MGNLVLLQCISETIKHDFRMYIRWYTSTNNNFEYGYPNSNALIIFFLKKQ